MIGGARKRSSATCLVIIIAKIACITAMFGSPLWGSDIAPVRHGDDFIYINFEGDIVIDRRLEGAGHFREGRARAKMDGRWGYIDMSGEFAIDPKYIYANDFQNGIARVGTGDSLTDRDYHFIDRNGNVWGENLPVSERGRVQGFSEGVLSIHADDTNYLVNRQGEIVAALRSHMMALPFSGGLAVAYARDRRNAVFVGCHGDVVIDAGFRTALSFSEGLAPVEVEDDEWIFINYAGEGVFERKFNKAYPFSEGLARVGQRSGEGEMRYGYLGRSGVIRIGLEFRDAQEFSEGMAAVKGVDDHGEPLWGYINHAGAWVVEPQYQHAQRFRSGIARVLTRSDEWIYINQSGTVVWPAATR